MSVSVIRIGGVAEPFNLPIIRAFETSALSDLGVEVTFTPYAGGTGALISALEAGEIDLATVLTEGGLKAVADGRAIGLHSQFTDSPLRWGIFVAAKSKYEKTSEISRAKFAVSRHGSGSELMAYVLADKAGFKLNAGRIVETGGLDGAVEALTNRKAHVFLWERFVTAPLVAEGIFRRIGDFKTPWPAFQLAARSDLLANNGELVDRIAARLLLIAAQMANDTDALVDEIVARYGLSRRDARSWAKGIEWADKPRLDADILADCRATLVELGRIAPFE